VSSTRGFEPPRIVIGDGSPPFTRLTRQDWRVDNDGGWGKTGTWNLRVAGMHRFRVRALLAEACRGQLELQLGERRIRSEVAGPAQRAQVDEILLTAGLLDLRARFLMDGEVVGVHQILLERL
jgi:hypothetical protein